ncbi:hypothetical protein Trichorick_01454 (plasmid) [Candidatus Trichorickettsia mobilis]|uniref:Uncharacterized protein n=1 Tax=Candidatus Trichorickettsia mobilis TaxID=1346319 RepID=A0ABZ0UVK9_9RICK|nr:hypothetical protein Trichorick_01454 [Candidatus Trichorickettsia mobilis]
MYIIILLIALALIKLATEVQFSSLVTNGKWIKNFKNLIKAMF